MIKNFVKYITLGVLLAGVASCNKEAQEPLGASSVDEGANLGFSLSVQAEDIELGAETEEEMRKMGYDLVGAKKLLQINFERVAEEAGTSEKVVPVHLFFINTKEGISSRIYKQVMMNVEGKRQLSLPFTNFPEVREKYRDDNADYWYVKGFIGGQRYNNGGRTYKTTNGIQFIMDGMYDITDETQYYVTGVTQGIVRAKYRRPDPMPMESAWRPIKFFFKEADIPTGNDAAKSDGNPDYPTDGQMLDFKPIGSILRLKVQNTLPETYSCRVLSFSPPTNDPNSFDRYGTPEQQRKQIYVNNISRMLKVMPQTTADGKMHPDVMADPMGGMTTEIHKNGMNNYFFGKKPVSSTASYGNSDTNIQSLPIASGASRYFLFWVFEDQSVTVNEAFFQPYIHNANNVEDLNSSAQRVNKPIYLGNSEHGIRVRKGQYENGKTYFISTKLVPRP